MRPVSGVFARQCAESLPREAVSSESEQKHAHRAQLQHRFSAGMPQGDASGEAAKEKGKADALPW